MLDHDIENQVRVEFGSYNLHTVCFQNTKLSTYLLHLDNRLKRKLPVRYNAEQIKLKQIRYISWLDIVPKSIGTDLSIYCQTALDIPDPVVGFASWSNREII